MWVEGVEFIDFERPGRGVIVCSGSGIGLSLMDVFLDCRYLVDIDSYRMDKSIDWECVAVLLSTRRQIDRVIMAGWFTIDVPVNFNAFQRGLLVENFVYRGGGSESLAEFVNRIRNTPSVK